MITTNAPDVPGREFEVLGTVMGCAFGDLGHCGVRSRDGAAEFGRMMGTRGLDSFDVTGSKRVSAPQKLRLLHAIAEEGMVREAEALGADAVVCVRHTTSGHRSGRPLQHHSHDGVPRPGDCGPLPLTDHAVSAGGSYMYFLQNGISIPPMALPIITRTMNTSASSVYTPAEQK